MSQHTGKVAVVTGAASGIGAALGRAFASEGMSVMLADVQLGQLEVLAEELRRNGATVVTDQVDVTNASAVKDLAQRTLTELGRVDFVCNNAGVLVRGAVAETPDEDWRWALDVHFWGILHGIRAFLPILQEQNSGHIINTCSMSAVISSPFSAPYVASKAAALALTESLFLELKATQSKIAVSIVLPETVATNLAQAELSRPKQYGQPRPNEGEIQATHDVFQQTGTLPSEVAARVLEALQSKRFWILPPTEDPMMQFALERQRRFALREDPRSIL
jgi:short-subunit dehydrogenase